MISKFEVQILDKIPLTKNTFIFTLDCDSLEFKAGQFLTFIMKDTQGKPKPRSYSIFSAPKQYPVQLLVECIDGGVAGEAFKAATPDTQFTVRGPIGNFYFQEDHKKHIFIVTNTGLSPIHSMIAQHVDGDYDMTLIFGAKTKEGLYYDSKFSTLAKTKSSFSYMPTLSRESVEGIPQGYVQKLIPFDMEAQYYICGSPQMVKDSIKVLEENNISKENVHYEIF